MHQTFYLYLFLRMPARGAADLKLASKKPLLVLWMGFLISRLGLLYGFLMANRLDCFERKIEGPNS